MIGRGSISGSALRAGLVGAVLVATPVLGKLNYCCCALVVVTGLFAAWMLRSDSAGSAPTASCAAAGLLAGALAALLGTPLGACAKRVAWGQAHLEAVADEQIAALRQAMENQPQPPPPGFIPMTESLVRAQEGLELGGWLVVLTLFTVPVHAFFGLLGGLLGGAFFRGRRAPRPPAPPPPFTSGGHRPAPEPPVAPDPLPPPRPAEPTPPPALGPDGEPDVRWPGPVVDTAGGAWPHDSGATGAPAPGGATGEIPLDQLPLLGAPDPGPESKPPEPHDRLT